METFQKRLLGKSEVLIATPSDQWSLISRFTSVTITTISLSFCLFCLQKVCIVAAGYISMFLSLLKSLWPAFYIHTFLQWLVQSLFTVSMISCLSTIDEVKWALVQIWNSFRWLTEYIGCIWFGIGSVYSAKEHYFFPWFAVINFTNRNWGR